MNYNVYRFVSCPLLIGVFLTAGCSVESDSAGTDKEIRKKTEEMVTASQSYDQAWYKNNRAADYIITAQESAAGSADEFAAYTSGSNELDSTSFRINDWRTVKEGDTTVAFYKLRWKFAGGANAEAHVTDVWTQRNGQWKLLAQHVSRISLAHSSAYREKEKKEVIEFVKNCSVGDTLNIEALAACLHDDYSRWENGALKGKVAELEEIAGYLKKVKDSNQTFEARSAVVHADTAVVNYTISYAYTNEAGVMVRGSADATDVCMRQNGLWRIISSHFEDPTIE